MMSTTTAGPAPAGLTLGTLNSLSQGLDEDKGDPEADSVAAKAASEPSEPAEKVPQELAEALIAAQYDVLTREREEEKLSDMPSGES